MLGACLMKELGQVLSCADIRDLVSDIVECIESPTGQEPRATKVAETVLILEIDHFKFRIEIQDMNGFQ